MIAKYFVYAFNTTEKKKAKILQIGTLDIL